jgi:hypothetical protein
MSINEFKDKQAFQLGTFEKGIKWQTIATNEELVLT